MRVHTLMAGLLSLVGLTISAPTPQSPTVQLLDAKLTSRAPECTTAEPDKWLITICGKHTITNSIGLNMLNHCSGLSGEAQHQVTTTIQQDGLVCYFYDDSNYCKSDYMIATVTHHAELPDVYGRRARYVMCEKKITGKRADAVEVQARTLDFVEVSARAPDVVDLEARAPECVSFEPGKYVVTVCGNSTVTNSMPHKELEFCVRLSDGLANHVISTIQEKDSICKFYDGEDGCNNDFLIATTTAKSRIPMSIGKKIRNMACWKTGNAAELETRDVDMSLDSTTDQLTQTDVTEVPNSVTDEQPIYDIATQAENASPEEVHTAGTNPTQWPSVIAEISGRKTTIIVNDFRIDTCVFLHGVDHHVERTIQHNFAVCQFFASPKCDGEPVLTVKFNEFGYVNRAISTDVDSQITHVKCGVWGFPGIGTQDEDASATDLPHLEFGQLRIGEDRGDTHIRGAINALDDCVDIPPLQHPDSTRILDQSGRTECEFYAEAGCSRAYMLSFMNPGEEDMKVKVGWAQDINSAKCTILESIAPASIQARTPEQPGLEPGQLRVGEDLYDAHIRHVVNALDGCVEFPTPMFPDATRFLGQSGRSKCLFYSKTACSGPPILHTLHREEKDLKQPAELAQQIKSAQCDVFDSIEVPPGSIDTRSEPNLRSPLVHARSPPAHVNPKDIRVTVNPSISALSTPFLKVGDLHICNQPSFDPAHCTVLHTLNTCVAFPGAFARQTKLITQAKGSFCKYYTKPGCMNGDEYFRYMSNPTQDAQLSGWGVEKLAGVWCGGTGAAADTAAAAVPSTASVNVDTIDASPNKHMAEHDMTPRSNPFYHWSTSPGSTTVCRQKNYAYCTNNAINALHQCANFAPADQGPASFIQYAGVYCKWYTNTDCKYGHDKPYSILDSRPGDMNADGVLDGTHKEVRLYRSVKCEKDIF